MDKKISRFNSDMNSERPVTGDTLLQHINTYFIELKFANATKLARSGQYTQAETIISEILTDRGETPTILDLQARIYAQQGRIAEAEITWRKALLLDPSNSTYQEALHHISKMQRRPIWLIPLFYLLIGLLLIIVLFVGTTILINQIKMSSPSQLSDISQNNKNIEKELIAKLATLENSLQSLKSSSVSLFPPDMELNISGISTRTDGNELIVIFKQGLFEGGTVLSSKAKNLLTELGNQLEPYASRIHIKIYGSTDNILMTEGQKYHDNIDLGKARANVVFDHFRNTTQLPPDRILIGSYGEYLPPFPNDIPENRSKNRTVVIKIIQKK